MRKSDFSYFHVPNYLDIELHDLILKEISILDNTDSVTINQDGTISYIDPGKGHIRNNRINDDVLDQILTPGIRQLKDITKNLLLSKGMMLPVARGFLNFPNPNSMAWHKDYVEPDMQIDPKKRIVVFYVVAPEMSSAKFMVSPDAEGPGIWNLGFKLDLTPNTLIGHNQNLGHEYIRVDDKEIHIFSILWYDMA